MSQILNKIGLGGGCHWCTEAVFQSLNGVSKVEQGFVASTGDNTAFSEAVIVHYDSVGILLKTLVEIHLHTHKCTFNHAMRTKYRSAVYVFSEAEKQEAEQILELVQNQFKDTLITEVLLFNAFKASREQIQNYYYSNPEKPFCKSFINPKLKLLLNRFSMYANQKKLNHLQNE